MGIESKLKREGIIVKEELDKIKVNTIAKNVAQKIVAAFPELDMKLGEVFIKLSQLKMYYAEVPKGYSEANYFYKNSSIYFNCEVPIDEIEKYAIHECIHYLQERKDKAGFLLRLGLCDLTQYKVHGLALNEAAVQYATAKATKEPKDSVKYYGISFETISPTCYPLICNLIAQMAYVTGEKVLFDSTFNSNDNFKEEFIDKTSETTYYKLEKKFDRILKLEENLLKLNNKMELSDNLNSGLNKKRLKIKNEIQKTFMESQELIITSYFDKVFNTISNLEQVENYRRSLYNFKDLVGYVDGIDTFNEYYIKTMTKLEDKYNELENSVDVENVKEEKVGLPIERRSKLQIFWQTIKKFLFKSGDEYQKEVSDENKFK